MGLETSKRASKRERNRLQRRASIVDVATRYFFEHGYAATSMSAIAEELGGSKATLWSHFASKDELFAAVVDARVQRVSDDITDFLTAQTFSIASLKRFLQRFLECLMQEDSIKLFRLVIGEGERFPEIQDLFWQRGPTLMFNQVSEFYGTAFEPEESRRLARVTIAAIAGFRSHLMIAPPEVIKSEAALFVESLVSHLHFPKCTQPHEAPSAP